MRWIPADSGSRLYGHVSQLVPSSADLVTVAAYLLSLTRPISNPDVYLHLAVGESIWRTRQIPRTNLFSFVASDFPWVDHAWLSQLLLFILSSFLGGHWLVLLRGLCFAVAVGLLYRLLRRKGGVLPSLGLVTVAMLASVPGLSVGPEVFAAPLLVTLLTFLEDRDWRLGRSIFFLPPLFLLWVNLDRSFALGLMVLVLHLLGGLIDWRRGVGGTAWFYHLMGLMPAFLFTLWNPYYSGIYLQGIADTWGVLTTTLVWLPSQLGQVGVLLLNALPALTTYWLVRGSFHWRLALPVLAVGLVTVANPSILYLWTLLTTVAVMDNLQILAERVRHGPEETWQRGEQIRQWLRQLGDQLKRVSFVDRRFTSRTYTWLTAAVTLALFSVPPGGQTQVLGLTFRGLSLEAMVAPDVAPVSATQFLRESAFPQARVLVPVESAGYVLYQTRGQVQLLFDGRSDAYPHDIVEDYERFGDMEPGWEAVLDSQQVDYLMWSAASFQPRALVTGGGWQLIYADSLAVVLVRVGKAVAEVEEMVPPWWRVEQLGHPSEQQSLTPGPQFRPGGMFGTNRTGPEEGRP